MHDDVRTLVQEAAERIVPPPPDIAPLRVGMRRRLAVLAASAVVAVALASGVALTTVSALRGTEEVVPADAPRTLLSVSSRDERRPRNDRYAYLYGKLRSHSVDSSGLEVVMGGAIGPAPKTTGLRNIDADCYSNPMRPRNTAVYCFARYAVVRDGDPRHEYRVGFLQGLSQSFPDATLYVVRHSFSLTGGELVATQPGVRAPFETECAPSGIELEEPTFSLRPRPWRVCGDTLTRIARDAHTFVFEWTGEMPPRPVRLQAVVVWRFPKGGRYVLDVGHEQVAHE